MSWTEEAGQRESSSSSRGRVRASRASGMMAGFRFSRRHVRQIVPFLASMGLLAWLTWRVSPGALLDALAQLNWLVLIPLTAVLVLGTWIGDAIGLRVLFSTPQRKLSFRSALLARGRSYFSMSFNFGLGQGHLAWIMARLQGRSLAWSLGRCLLLVYVDLYVLLGLGWLGAMLTDHPNGRWIAIGCVGGLTLLGVTAWLVRFLPGAARHADDGAGTHADHSLAKWWLLPKGNSRLMLKLAAIRVGYFSIGMTYAVVGMTLCSIGADPWLIISSVPLMALADGLPISVSGLGTRESTLMMLLNPNDPARLLAFCVSWSGLTLLARAVIGVILCWKGRKTEAVP